MPMRSPFVVMFAFVLLVLTVISSAAQATTPVETGWLRSLATGYRIRRSGARSSSLARTGAV